MVAFKMGFLCCCYEKEDTKLEPLIHTEFDQVGTEKSFSTTAIPEGSCTQDTVRSFNTFLSPDEELCHTSSEQNYFAGRDSHSKSETLRFTCKKARKQSFSQKIIRTLRGQRGKTRHDTLQVNKYGSLYFPLTQKTITGGSTRSISYIPLLVQKTITGCSATSISSYAPLPMTQILPHLYLGTIDDAFNEKELRQKGITHILSLYQSRSSVNFVKHEQFPMHDLGRTDLKEVMEKVLVFIEEGQENGNNILVHCMSGQNRSATVVIAYLLKAHHYDSLYIAHKKVKKARCIVQINRGYAIQLLALEKDIFGKNTLPQEWMERGDVNMVTGEVNYKYECIESDAHKNMVNNGEI